MLELITFLTTEYCITKFHIPMFIFETSHFQNQHEHFQEKNSKFNPIHHWSDTVRSSTATCIFST